MAAKTHNERIAAGLCPKCCEPHAGRRIHCANCLSAIRVAVRNREANGTPPTKKARQDAGLCACGVRPPAPNRKMCGVCLKHAKTRYDKRKHSGQCVSCGQAPSVRGLTRCEPCGVAYSARLTAYIERQRLRVMNAYGGAKCACCGEKEMEFLTIDHIDGGGAQHRKQLGGNSVVNWLIKNGFPAGYQVLCMNCNWAKGKYGCCPHVGKARRGRYGYQPEVKVVLR